MLEQYYRICAEVDLDSIRKNILNMQARIIPGTLSCAVIKADGYGHGAVPIAKAISDIVDFFAVATIEEAINLRAHEIFKPILVLGYVHPSRFKAAVENDIRLTVYDETAAIKINEAAKLKGRKALVHIKIDTGMNRLGFRCDDFSEKACEESKMKNSILEKTCAEDELNKILRISKLENVEIEGAFTHLYLSDSKDKTLAYEQIKKFCLFTDSLAEAGVKIPIRHLANSAAVIDMPDASFDMVRMGVAIYGLYPSEDVHDLKLEPALSLKSHIVMVKTVPAGQTIGYGGTFRAERDSIIATIPVGYADGYQRTLSNKGCVLIRGQKAPITGRVCMDYIMADVTDIKDVCEGDEVVLIGSQEGNCISVEDLGEIAGIFNYEFVCDISNRVPRVYYLDGKLVSYVDHFFTGNCFS